MKLPGLPVNHLVIASPEPLALASFYESALGMERLYLRPEPSEGPVQSVWLGDESGPILMIERATNRRHGDRDFFAKSPGLHMIALQISAVDSEAWTAHLRQIGVAIVHQSEYTIYFADPEGNRVGLSWFQAREFFEQHPE